MITKTKLQEQLNQLPEEFSIDELVERLILIEKVDRGLEQSKKDQFISENDLGEEIEKWFE